MRTKKDPLSKISKITLFLYLIIILSTICYADSLEFDKENWDESVTEPRQIDLAMENGETVTPTQFSYASDSSKETYILGENADFSVPIQRAYFQDLANRDGFNYDTNKKVVVEYLGSLNDLYDDNDQSILQNAMEVDINIINENPDLLKAYAEAMGISLSNVTQSNFSSYNSNTSSFTTGGNHSTTFSFDHLSVLQSQGYTDFGINDQGELTFESGENTITISGGYLDIGNNGDIVIVGGTITTSYITEGITAPEDCPSCTMSLGQNGSVTATGSNFNLPSSTYLNNGSANVYSDTSFSFSSGTTFSEIDQGDISVEYTISEETNYYTTESGCTTSNCIERNKDSNYLEITSNQGNQITIQDNSDSINWLNVARIEDSSTVTYTDDLGNEILFSDSPIQIAGDQSELPKSSCSFTKTENGVTNYCYTYIGSGAQSCSTTDRGVLISNTAQEIMENHNEAIEANNVGTHFGTKSRYAWAMADAPEDSSSAGYGDYVNGQTSSGLGFSHEQALLYSLLLDQGKTFTYDSSITDPLLGEAKIMGLELDGTEEVMHYFNARQQQEQAEQDYQAPSALSTWWNNLRGNEIEQQPQNNYGEALKQAQSEAEQQRLMGNSHESTIRRTSCIDICMEVMNTALDAARESSEASNIDKTFRSSNGNGLAVGKALDSLGWQPVYMAPDSENPHWNRPKDQTYGYAYAASMAENGRQVHGITPDAVITDFNPTTSQITGLTNGEIQAQAVDNPTTQNTELFDALQNNPSVNGGFIMAKGGYHNALLIRNQETGKLQVFENHWKAGPSSTYVFDSTNLEDWDWGGYYLFLNPEADISNLNE